MPIETAIWRMDNGVPVPVPFQRLDLESRLEDLVVADPSLAGLNVIVLGRQVPTAWGGIIDVVALDGDAHIHVLELKRDRTPRDVVAQVLDYGSWVQNLTYDQAAEIYAETHDDGLDDAFAERFGAELPDVFNADQQLTIVASQLDGASERIVEYLAERFAVPVNAVFFRHFVDGANEYLARTWLMPPEQIETRRPPTTKSAPWNGRDWYCILGTRNRHVRWDVCRKYGLVSGGGARFHWETLAGLQPGHRVFAHVGDYGYVGVGEVTGTLSPFKDMTVDGSDQLIVDQPEVEDWQRQLAEAADPDNAEYGVPVRWLHTVDLDEAFWERGLFSNQRSCRLKKARTIEAVARAFGVDD